MANRYSLTFHADGGEPDVQTITATYGEPIGMLPSVSKTQSIFLGWFNEDTGTYITRNTRYAIASDHDYHAHWKAREYVVHWNGNGGTPEKEYDYVEYGSTV